MTFVEARKYLKEKDYEIGKIRRRDIFVKGTLRKMRKYFLSKFVDMTNYIKENRKRNKNPNLLLEKLGPYVEN